MIMLAVAAKRTYREIGAACEPPISSARVEQIVKQERKAGRIPDPAGIPGAWIEPFVIGNPDTPDQPAPADTGRIDEVMESAGD